MTSAGQFNASPFAALAAFGSEHSSLRLHAQRAVRFTVQLGPQGEVLRVVTHPKATPDSPPYLTLSPREAKARTSGLAPLLLTDNAMYVLGLEKPGAKKAAGAETHRISGIAGAEPALAPDARGIPRRAVATPDLFEDVQSEDLIAFTVGGINPHHQPEVQAFWITQALPEGRTSRACSVTGIPATLAYNSPLVTGIPGGKANLTIQSKNAGTFTAYGLDDLGIAQDTIEAVQKAINTLSRDPLHVWRIKGLDAVTLHFTLGPGVDPWQSLAEPGNEEISAALQAQITTHSDTTLHLLKLQGNAARLMVLDYRVLSLTEASQHAASYLRRTGSMALWKAESVLQDAGGKVIPGLIDELHALIFTGQRPSPDLRRHLLTRFMQNLRLSRTEVTLLYLTYPEATMHDPQRLPAAQFQAYQLGQFLAVCDDLHRQANPAAQQHVGDLYLRSFPSATERGFVAVSDRLSSVISSLRPRQPGLAVSLSRRLSAATSDLTLPLPKRLDVESQSAFVVGYLQGKDRQFTAQAERRAQKAQQHA